MHAHLPVVVKVALLAVLAVFAPVHAVILTALCLVGVDFITGVWAAKKRGEVISSGMFRRTLTKLAIFEVAICVAFLIETYLTGSLVPGTKLVGALVGLVEGTSILENLDSLYGGNLFRDLLSKLNRPEDKK